MHHRLGRIAKGQTPKGPKTEKGLLAVPATAQPTKATLLVETLLLSLGAEEASVPELAQDARALHGGLEPLQKAFGVFPVSKLNDGQGFPPKVFNNAKDKDRNGSAKGTTVVIVSQGHAGAQGHRH